MAKGGFSHTAIEETQYLIQQPSASVQAEKKQGFVFTGHNNIKTGIETQSVMAGDNQPDGCLSCANVTATNPQTSLRLKKHGCTSVATSTTSIQNALCAIM
jgi:hypothetical protein